MLWFQVKQFKLSDRLFVIQPDDLATYKNVNKH